MKRSPTISASTIKHNTGCRRIFVFVDWPSTGSLLSEDGLHRLLVMTAVQFNVSIVSLQKVGNRYSPRYLRAVCSEVQLIVFGRTVVFFALLRIKETVTSSQQECSQSCVSRHLCLHGCNSPFSVRRLW